MQRKILIVEDEPSIAENISYALTTEGFDPMVVGTANEALVALETESYALVVLDVGLPDIDGFEVARRIRRSSAIPIIFLTARSSEIDRVVGLELGGDDYIVKPFSVRELTARVKAVLRRFEGSKQESNEGNCQAQKSAGPFVIDEKRYQILYHNTAVPLSRYEFRLLRVMVRSPGRVYSREQLMQLAWEEPDMSLERTVDTHIKTIRQKLRSIEEEIDPIITHRGLGYSLREDL